MARCLAAFAFLVQLSAPAQSLAVPGTGVTLAPPPGMERASRFAGFQAKGEDASIMVTEMAAPPEKLTEGLRDKEKLAAQRMTLLGKEQVALAAGKADLFTFEQRHAGSTYRKLVLVLGDSSRTAMVAATCDAEIADKWLPLLRASLLTSTLGARRGSVTGFRIEPAGDFKEAQTVSNSIVLRLRSDLPTNDRRTVLFIGNRSFAPVPLASLAQFAESRAKTLPSVTTLKIIESKPIEIDGLEGHELVALANQATANDAVLIYEVVLREKEGGYFLLVGQAPQEQISTYLPLFRTMSGSFRRE